MNTKRVIALFVLLAVPLTALAEEPRQFVVDIKIYRVLTNISGETSRQLEGVPGSFHTGEMIFDTVTATMKGGELKWNGKDEPDHPRIIPVSSPRLVTLLDQEAEMVIQESKPLQYFAKKSNGDYELKVSRAETGIRVRFRISEEKEDGVLVMRNFLFESRVATGRKKLEGVDLDVGKPIIDTRRVEGPLQCRAGEWVGITYRVPSQGAIYIFMKVEPMS